MLIHQVQIAIVNRVMLDLLRPVIVERISIRLNGIRIPFYGQPLRRHSAD